MEFQKVFAWSYEDMPGINPEIAQYHIDTHDLMVPVKNDVVQPVWALEHPKCILKLK